MPHATATDGFAAHPIIMQSTFRVSDPDAAPIRIDMHEPATGTPHAAIVLLHGAGGNVGYWLDNLAPHLTAAGVALYAPHYFDRTGTIRADYTTITDGLHVPQWISTVDAAIAFAAARPGVDPRRIAMVGVSLGAYLALGLAAQLSASPIPEERRRIRAIVELSGGLIAPFAGEATSSFPPTLIVHGEKDSIVPATEAYALDEQLTRLKVLHELRIFPGEDHWLSSRAQMELLLAVSAFLSKHLMA